MFFNPYLGKSKKPKSATSLKTTNEKNFPRPLIPSDPEWRAWTKVTSNNGYDIFHESTSLSTVVVDYIDVFHTFYKNGQLIGFGFDSQSPGQYATVGQLETGVGNPGYLWEAYGDHLFQDAYYGTWNPITYDSMNQ